MVEPDSVRITAGRAALIRISKPVVGCITAMAVFVGMTGCGGHFPADPEGTLERVTGGELRAGVVHQPPWTDVTDESHLTGTEVQLIEEFAETLDAEVSWLPGGEEGLFSLLEQGELDVVIGGFTTNSPWSTHAALTTSYTESTGPDGSKNKHVMAVHLGENAFMVELERFLLDHQQE